ncbi:MAG: metal ABC transporter substrate-binding protein [Silicimonas sp.]|nr:metal ABC transporter substrate-binding protein [Silicimonas sp.]
MRLGAGLLAGCAAFLFSFSAVEAEDRPRVVAVNAPLQYFAARLLDEGAEVEFPVPDGVDPSFWRPTIADISRIQGADLILLNGAGFATWIDRVSLPRSRLVNASAALKDRFIVTESITHSHGEGGEHSHEGLASYLWLDPLLAVAQAEAVAAALTRKGLAPGDAVAARLAALRADLEALDDAAAAALEGAGDVTMIATHPRYHYLARRYGLSISALEWEAGAMPSPEDLATLEGLVTQTGAKVLIWEAAPPAGAFAATEALGLQNVVFDPLARSEGPFIEGFAASVEALAAAVRAVAAN